jgi:hypothetical protein
LLDDDVLDEKLLKLQALCIGVRLCVFQEASDELYGFLGPTTYINKSVSFPRSSLLQYGETHPVLP